MRSEIQDALDSSSITFADIIAFLDETEPWAKQHIYLLQGPQVGASQWRRSDYVLDLLKQHKLSHLYNRRTVAILPSHTHLISVQHKADHLRVTAVAKREGAYRDSRYDERRTLSDGTAIELRAYVHEVYRNIVALDWDLGSNEAMLQITQLPSGVSYETARDDFIAILAPWLDFTRFSEVKLHGAIRRLHELEESGDTEIMSVAIDYQTQGGRRLTARGASDTPLLGETVTDEALRQVRQVSAGRIGNFYWQPTDSSPLIDRVHVYIIADHSRFNITIPQTEQVIRYVAGRIRHHSR